MAERKIDKKAVRTHSAVLRPVLICVGVFAAVMIIIFFAVVPAVEAHAFLYPEKEYMTTFPYELGLRHKFYEITAPDGSIMASWFIPAQTPGSEVEYEDIVKSDKTVIFSHNLESNKDMEEINAMYLARDFVSVGYNVLMFDYSGSGSSTGEGYMLGIREAEELKSVIKFASENIGCEKISVIGWGFGAASALMACSAENGVDAVIADSSYCELEDYLSHFISDWTDTLSFMSPITLAFTQMFADVDLYSDTPLEAVKRNSGMNYFFIQGQNDTVFPSNCYSVLNNAAAESNNVKSWCVTGCDHIMGFVKEPENYFTYICEFLDGVYSEEEA